MNLKIKVKALSNLFIGGAPRSFEIGGIDQWTAVDEEGFPCIPASSLKGALRAVVKKDSSNEAEVIAGWYADWLRREKESAKQQISTYLNKNKDKNKDMKEMIDRIEEQYVSAAENASPVYLFGIEKFNDTPKLLFNDLRLTDEYRNLGNCFSIDAKTSIDSNGAELKSNPRTYKAVKTGMEFEGVIDFYGFEGNEDFARKCRVYIAENLQKFNAGVYRLGNSKSRGYGKICVTIM